MSHWSMVDCESWNTSRLKGKLTAGTKLNGFFLFISADGLGQERRNSIANAVELRLSCTNPSMWLLIVA